MNAIVFESLSNNMLPVKYGHITSALLSNSAGSFTVETTDNMI